MPVKLYKNVITYVLSLECSMELASKVFSRDEIIVYFTHGIKKRVRSLLRSGNMVYLTFGITRVYTFKMRLA